MRRLEELLIPDGRGFVSITGGGGKTGFMIAFAQYLRQTGKSVLLTTTTHVESPSVRDYGAGYVFVDKAVFTHEACKGEIVFYAEGDGQRLSGPSCEALSLLSNRYDVILCEADGSRHKPLKVHSSRDPVIHPCTTATVAVMGLWGIGERISDAVFGDDRPGLVDQAYLDWYIVTSEGLLKGMTGNKLVLLNGGECYEVPDIKLPEGIAECVISLKEGRIYSYVR